MATTKKLNTSMTGKDSGIVLNAKDDGPTQVVELVLPNGTFVEVTVSRYGGLKVNHGKAVGGTREDERTILTGSLNMKKRSFNVYSSSGYMNSYRGKPINLPPTSAAPAAAPATTSAPATASTSTPAPTATAPTTAASIPDVKSLAVGDNVTRGTDTGTVVNQDKDAVGVFIEVEWKEAGFETLYKEDMAGVALAAPPTPASPSGTSEPSEEDASVSTTETPASPSPDGGKAPAKKTPRKRAKKATLTLAESILAEVM